MDTGAFPPFPLWSPIFSSSWAEPCLVLLLAEEEGPPNLGGEKLNLPMNFGPQIRAGRVWSAPLLLPRARAARLGCVPGAVWVLSACPLSLPQLLCSLFRRTFDLIAL